MKKTFLLIITLFLVICKSNIAYTQQVEQNIGLKEGFNFVSFKVSPLLTPLQLKEQFSIIEDVYLYSTLAGSFLSANDGTLTSLSAGKGYIIKSKTAIDINIGGATVQSIGDIKLKKGFNLVGFSKLLNSFKFKELIENNGIIKGIYKWHAVAGSFLQVLKNNISGTVELIDGVNPDINSGEAYFIDVYDDTILNYDDSETV